MKAGYLREMLNPNYQNHLGKAEQGYIYREILTVDATQHQKAPIVVVMLTLSGPLTMPGPNAEEV
jgi:hypothetical protein